MMSSILLSESFLDCLLNTGVGLWCIVKFNGEGTGELSLMVIDLLSVNNELVT